MAISSTAVITSEVNNYTLSELLDTLGSPKKLKAALEELEVASKKAAAAQRDLDTSERIRIDAVEMDAEARAKEIVAISNDKTALAAAWAKLDEDTAAHNSQNADACRLLKRDQAALKVAEAALASQTEALDNAREILKREKEVVDGQVADARRAANADLKAAKQAKEDATRRNSMANEKMANMRKLVA
tara:strand:+ start:39 stop:605 length:567 start_codon:yes stop_codon:yes gene_type:complete